YSFCAVAAALSMPHDSTPGETAMRLRIQLLQQGEAVKDRLQRDGWKLKDESSETLSACHAAVDSEPAARRRLNGLGLLTSATLRNEFPLVGLSRGGGWAPTWSEWPTKQMVTELVAETADRFLRRRLPGGIAGTVFYGETTR